MDMNLIEQMLQAYQLSLGALIGTVILILVLALLLLSVFSMLGAKVLQASRPNFGPAILAVLSYFGLSIVLGLIYQIFPDSLLYSPVFDIISLAISFVLFSWLSSCFFKTTFVKGMGITLITFILLIVLVFVMALIGR